MEKPVGVAVIAAALAVSHLNVIFSSFQSLWICRKQFLSH